MTENISVFKTYYFKTSKIALGRFRLTVAQLSGFSLFFFSLLSVKKTHRHKVAKVLFIFVYFAYSVQVSTPMV